MVAYYNEINPYAAQWLRNLVAQNLIAPGDVDERSIADVKPDDLKGYAQCHFFAGIGGWSYALRLALWPDDRPVWTGSCPCQGYSVAGKQQAKSDPRNLWPDWRRLIGQSKPATIFGEQVTGAITFGWLDEVAYDLETEGYAFASSVLPACAVAAPHQRDRVWFVADAECGGIQKRWGIKTIIEKNPKSFGICGDVGSRGVEQKKCLFSRPDSKQQQEQRITKPESSELSEFKLHSGWKIEPEMGRVVNGFFGRTQQLRAYGNAIVPQVAAAFIQAYDETIA